MEVKVLFTGLLSPAQGVLSRWQETRREEGTPADLFARDIPGLPPPPTVFPYGVGHGAGPCCGADTMSNWAAISLWIVKPLSLPTPVFRYLLYFILFLCDKVFL